MDDVARARGAAREALANVEPERLRQTLDDRLVDAAVTPGVLSLTVTASEGIVAQDLAGYVLLALFLIKLSIVSHSAYVKRKRKSSKQNITVQSKNEVPL